MEEHFVEVPVGKLLNIQKLSVGTENVADLAAWQGERRAQTEKDNLPRHITRMWPKRVDEVLAGGSMYWVIKGSVLCRQRIIRFEPYDSADGVQRCAIVLDPELIRVVPTLRRPFQGWRYLKPEDAPMDLPAGREAEEPLPAALSAALAEIGIL